ncbi:MAG: hypothetical protein HY829_15855 [Actinobacteria bacterium]|nr:hypothetical protein [Actinomycetota bacterium]
MALLTLPWVMSGREGPDDSRHGPGSGTGLAAATAMAAALKTGDFSLEGLSGYRAELDRSFVGAD